ncbi:MAG TPA: hypothetical protein VD907_06770 [Verrucomicrobiae bacterium]|nr:hypothetical protein [Verrucomicrobiae bacterium]
MKRYTYIKKQADELFRLNEKMEKLSDRYQSENTSQKQIQKINAEMNWLGMQIGQTEERIAFGLGLIQPEQVQKEWNPSGWHRYAGIEEELKRVEFS